MMTKSIDDEMYNLLMPIASQKATSTKSLV